MVLIINTVGTVLSTSKSAGNLPKGCFSWDLAHVSISMWGLSIVDNSSQRCSPNSNTAIRLLLRPYHHNWQYNNWRRYVNNIFPSSNTGKHFLIQIRANFGFSSFSSLVRYNLYYKIKVEQITYQVTAKSAKQWQIQIHNRCTNANTQWMCKYNVNTQWRLIPMQASVTDIFLAANIQEVMPQKALFFSNWKSNTYRNQIKLQIQHEYKYKQKISVIFGKHLIDIFLATNIQELMPQ